MVDSGPNGQPPAINKFPLIDIGVNLTSARFGADRDQVLERAQEQCVVHGLVTGTSLEESHEAIRLARTYPDQLSATAGVHPHVAKSWNASAADELLQLAVESPVVAVGECGLDFNRDFSPRDQQEACFAAQLAVATQVNKPVFLHERDAHQRFVGILREHVGQLPGAVVHCFTGGKDELFRYLELGCYIGITGWLCDERRGHDLREAVQHVPLDRLLLETDAPYLTPRTIKPKPPKGRNEPAYLPYVLYALADLLDTEPAVLAHQTTANACRLFNLNNLPGHPL